MLLKKPLSIVLAVAGVVLHANPTNAAALRHMIEESSTESRNDSTNAVLDTVVSLMESSSSMSISPKDCDHATTSAELDALISSNAGGEVRLCPGKVDFSSEIELACGSGGIIISCAGPDGSCILDGSGITRHFFSDSSAVSYVFSGLSFVNGFANDSSTNGQNGGSIRFSAGPTSTFDRCLFYNNRANSSSDLVVSIIRMLPIYCSYPVCFILTSFIILLSHQAGGAISVSNGKTVLNKCIVLDNVAETTATGSTAASLGGAVRVFKGDLTVSDSIFKKNKALQANLDARDGVGGGGAISVESSSSSNELIVLSSVFELNEASNAGGAAATNAKGTGSLKVNWVNNKELLLGNTAGEVCDGVVRSSIGGIGKCASVADNFIIEL